MHTACRDHDFVPPAVGSPVVLQENEGWTKIPVPGSSGRGRGGGGLRKTCQVARAAVHVDMVMLVAKASNQQWHMQNGYQCKS